MDGWKRDGGYYTSIRKLEELQKYADKDSV